MCTKAGGNWMDISYLEKDFSILQFFLGGEEGYNKKNILNCKKIRSMYYFVAIFLANFKTFIELNFLNTFFLFSFYTKNSLKKHYTKQNVSPF